MAYEGRLAPLYPVDLAELDWTELHRVAVAEFRGSWAREDIWKGFERFCANLARTSLSTQIYVGGSFVTRKRDPSDIDFTVGVEWPGREYTRREMTIIDKLYDARQNWKRRHRCDFEIVIEHEETALPALLDPMVNFCCYNSSGPPARPVFVKLSS